MEIKIGDIVEGLSYYQEVIIYIDDQWVSTKQDVYNTDGKLINSIFKSFNKQDFLNKLANKEIIVYSGD